MNRISDLYHNAAHSFLTASIHLLCLPVILMLLSATGIHAQTIYRVSPNGTGDGSSWSNTTSLRNALDIAREGDEIWVQGFKEAETHDKNKHYTVPADMPDGFVVREGIKLYGGFAGTENSIEERVFTEKVFCFTYRTILSGDIKHDDVINPLTLIFPSNTTRSDNATHVLYVHSGTGSTATTVNGFTIADGHADGDGEKGGGICVTGRGGNYIIEKCYFINNYATTGGAVYVEPDAGSPTSSVSLCRVFNNAAGIRSSSTNNGGGIGIAGYGHVDNCVITNNENGGVLLAANAYVINATIARNTVAGIDLTAGNAGNIQVYNTVIWRNTALYSSVLPGMAYCGFPEAPKPADGNHNIYVSESNNELTEYAPRFVYPSSKTGYDIESSDTYGDYQIWDWRFPYNSVLADHGTSNNITVLQSQQDITGSPRTVNGTTDIGAYEYQAVSADRIRYVKPGGTGRGTSWADAMGDPQNAINDLANTADGQGEVWVAEGIYEPQTQIITGREETVYFLMRDGIDMYGGFQGTEASKNERTLKTGGMPWDFEHETILQGNHYNGVCTWNSTNNCWEPTSNSRHIVWFAPPTENDEFKNNTVLNGFTIRGGYADGDGDAVYQPGRGAGVYMAGNSTLSNCIIKENRAYNEGGGVFCNTGTVEACLIYNNSSIQSNGGGVFLNSSGLIRRCAVINNSAHNGGGVYMDNNHPADNHPEYLILTSSVVSNNHSTENGAVFCNKGGLVLQSTVCNNYTPRATDAAVNDASRTGGVYINEYALVINSILWNNMNNDKRIPMYAQSPNVRNVQFINTAISDTENAVWNSVLQENIYEISSYNTDKDIIAPYFTTEGKTMTSDDALYEKIGIQSDWRAIDFYWIPLQGSPLRALGLTLGSFPSAVSVTPEVDLTGQLFHMKPSVGAVHIDAQPIVPAQPDAHTLRIYVHDVNTSPDHDGSSWALAYRSLNEALAYFGNLSSEATAGKNLEIYMQEHTSLYPRYYFTNNDPRTGTLQIPRTQSGQPILIRGGFSSDGGENRTYNPLTYRSIINGNPEGKTLHEGLYHCVTVSEGAEVIMEGFQVVNGYSVEGAQLYYGAGMRIGKDAKVTLRDCIFENNSAVTGAAVDAREASLTMENCVVNNNTCYDSESSQVIARNLTLNHVTFVHNEGNTYTVSAGGKSEVKNTFAIGNTHGNTHTDIAVTHENFANPTNAPGATLGFATYLGGYSNFRPLTSSKEMADYIINKGVVSDNLKEDIARNERNLGGIPDLGAYEALLPRSGRVYYVRTTADGGNDNNDGLSWEHPFATIRKAVNTALQGAVIDNEHPQVWVAAGTYQQDPTGSSYNCFDIEDGVNVYGAFPKTGTPGMDERHPLVSQYVYNNTNYKADDYETILQPNKNSGNRRVLGQLDKYNPVSTNDAFKYPTTWNGFTLQNGYINSNGDLKWIETGSGTARNGGAGVAIFKNMSLTNCIVYNNNNSSDDTNRQLRGGGIYCDGGTLVNCYIISNTLGGNNQNTAYGGGCYMRDGTAYNCVINKNKTIGKHGDGAAIFLDGISIFFNNTITNNSCDVTTRGNGGICTWNSIDVKAKLTIYNCISVNNTGLKGEITGSKDIASNGGEVECYHSLFETLDGTTLIKYDNTCHAISNPKDIFVDASSTMPNYRLSEKATFALNKGDNNPKITDANNVVHTYNLFNFTDMDYNPRIQDCTIDIGAFERDNSDMIDAQKDDTKKAYIYYVSNAGEGTADASSPENAACEMKLQQVLTAAGKKAAEVTDGYQVIVRIAGYDRDENMYHANTLELPDNPMSYTYVIPYGITVEGGWNDHYTSGTNNIPSFTEHNISKFHTTLTPVAKISGQDVNGFHAISFGNKPADWKKNDAVTLVDGLYLTGGSATSVSSLHSTNTRGGAAIVPAWGHVSRCIITGNEANMGGGLYLLPGALVSGCFISENNADQGAGIYAGQTDDIYGGGTADADTRAHIFTSTIVRNNANNSGGGISTEDGASLGQDLVVWGNKAPSDKNMSGVFDITFKDNLTADMLKNTTKENLSDFYPYNDCFVETFEMPTSMDNNTAMTGDQSVYFTGNYQPKMFSPLIKAGMKALYYQHLVKTYGLPEEDIYKMKYVQDGIDKIDVGCYAVLGGIITVDEKNIITRLFVSRDKRFDFTDDNINQYKGQSFLTPLSELDEALEYIKKVRSKETYKDTPFEIFITGGTYKPSYRRQNAQTTVINQRQNSFVVPAGVSIFGGFSGEELLSFEIKELKDAQGNTYTLTPKTDGDIPGILSARQTSDFNGNGISEPWELANQTILSGEINVSANEHYVYHVIYTNEEDNKGGEVLLDGLTITKGETVSELDPNAYNELGRGGGIYSNGVNYTLNRCRLLDNRAMRGNAIYARHADITVNGSFFANNNSVDNIPSDMASSVAGGAIYLSGNGKAAKLRAFSCLWTNNETKGNGGILATADDDEYKPSILLVNNTVARNKANAYSVAYVPEGEIINTLFWGNEQVQDGASAFSENNNLKITHSACEYPLTKDDEGNHNIKLNTVNMEVDGPRFRSPSEKSGTAGDASTNQWNPAAISVLADAGNGELGKDLKKIAESTGAYKDYMMTYLPDYIEQYMGTLTDEGKTTDYVRFAGPKDENGEVTVKPIDIGLYEYQYKLQFSDMDTVYIATYESGNADGTSWNNASSDLRGAIVALSHPTGNSSTNPTKHKQIFVRKGEYDYAISQLFAGGVAFNLQMGQSKDHDYGESLTIQGSYNNQGEQDFSNPSIITCNPVNADKTQQLMQINANGKHVTIEGFQFQNPNGQAIQAGAGEGGSVTLKNVYFRNNKEEAVTVNAHSGELLIVNALMADGQTGLDCGNQILEGGKVTVVNTTFANNTTDLTGTPDVYNSVAWHNTHQNLQETEGHYNVSIAPDIENTDIKNGPNFKDPDNANILQRDYSLRPSVRLLNKGNDDLYLEKAKVKEEDKEAERELNNIKRFIGTSVDVGAFEYPTPQQPIIYVKSGLASGTHDGTSWANATGDLQGAADLAGLYHYNYSENGYVFVHNNVTGASVDVKLDGAKIYGNMNDQTPILANEDITTAEEVQMVTDDLLNRRGGMMETTSHSSLDNVAVNTGCVVDGFEVTGKASLSKGGMLSTSILHESANITVDEGGILYNSFVDGDVACNGGDIINVTATGDIATEKAEKTANLRKNVTVTNAYIPTYVWTHQLNEESRDIDAGDLQDITSYMEYAGHKRDLAGNPRILNDKVDNGCMETWNVPAGQTWTTADDAKYYPVNGSVVYLHEDADFVLGHNTTFRPGYLLLKEGASLYGEQHPVQVAYVGVEKAIDEGWNMMAFPYTLTRDGIALPSYDADGRVQLASITANDSTEMYDGQARAASLYQYYTEASPFWKTGTSFPGGQGFALKAPQTGIYRFTGGKAANTDMVYTENGTDKTVTLTQYDLRNVTSDGKPNFTYKENMGWNLFGIPYLVSRYNLEKMDIPHVVYPFLNGTYSTIQTWNDGESTADNKLAATGMGVFTQTAVIGTTENLVFPQPAFNEKPSAAKRNKYHLLLSGEDGNDEFIFGRGSQESKDDDYVLGSDGLKLMAPKTTAPQVYATNSTGTRFSLLNEVNETCSVNIGVRTGGGEYTFSLNRTDSEQTAPILLTDRKTGKTINLEQTDYHFTTTADEDTRERFSLAFSHMAKENMMVNVYTRGMTLYVEGVPEGQTINVYDTSGQLVRNARSDGGTFSCDLARGVYIIKTSAATTRKILIQ